MAGAFPSRSHGRIYKEKKAARRPPFPVPLKNRPEYRYRGDGRLKKKNTAVALNEVELEPGTDPYLVASDLLQKISGLKYVLFFNILPFWYPPTYTLSNLFLSYTGTWYMDKI